MTDAHDDTRRRTETRLPAGPLDDDHPPLRVVARVNDPEGSTPPLRGVIGYVRKSKANRRRPDEEAHGVAAQKATIRREAAHRGWQMVWAPDDDSHTGANTRRPGLVWALGELAAGRADGIVVAKLDRLSRSVVDLGTILQSAQKQGWSVVALDMGIDTSTTNGRLMAHILISVAQWEREIIAQRTRDALAAAKANGVRLGRPSNVPADVVSAIVELREAGCTLDAIAQVLNQQDIPRAQGGTAWRTSTIRGVLTRTYEQTSTHVA